MVIWYENSIRMCAVSIHLVTEIERTNKMLSALSQLMYVASRIIHYAWHALALKRFIFWKRERDRQMRWNASPVICVCFVSLVIFLVLINSSQLLHFTLSTVWQNCVKIENIINFIIWFVLHRVKDTIVGISTHVFLSTTQFRQTCYNNCESIKVMTSSNRLLLWIFQ